MPRAQTQMNQVKAEVVRRAAQRDEELDQLKRRGLWAAQAAVDGDVRIRNGVLRAKKKMEGDLNEMEVQLSRANQQAAEAREQLRNVRGQLKVTWWFSVI